jgi:hypothetical protein
MLQPQMQAYGVAAGGGGTPARVVPTLQLVAPAAAGQASPFRAGAALLAPNVQVVATFVAAGMGDTKLVTVGTLPSEKVYVSAQVEAVVGPQYAKADIVVPPVLKGDVHESKGRPSPSLHMPLLPHSA